MAVVSASNDLKHLKRIAKFASVRFVMGKVENWLASHTKIVDQINELGVAEVIVCPSMCQGELECTVLCERDADAVAICMLFDGRILRGVRDV